MHQEGRWTQGDRRWGVIHEGRLYLFVSEQAKDAFWREAERYAPVFAGDDVVLFVDTGKRVPGKVGIGARQGEMDLAVNLPQLSGHHATVQLFKGGNVFVKDEHSTNGTFVDGRRLNPGERVQVRPGQIIRLSQHLELTLVQPGLQPAEPSSQVPIAAAPPSVPATTPPSAEAPRPRARTIYAPARGDDE